MSSPGFSVDNERLAQHAADFGAHADRAGDIAGALRQVVEALTRWVAALPPAMSRPPARR
jgi:hypothetical protein